MSQRRLDLQVVRDVREQTGNIPVVMHGGSGVSTEDFHQAVGAGVRKVNYFTYMDKSGGQAAKAYVEETEPQSPLFFSSLIARAEAAMKEDVRRAMATFALLDQQ